MRAAKVQASLRIRAVSPEPSLLAHTSSEPRGTFRQKARSLAPLNDWACTVKICHDGMLEDTNSLDGAQVLVNRLGLTMTIVVDWDVKQQIKQTKKPTRFTRALNFTYKAQWTLLTPWTDPFLIRWVSVLLFFCCFFFSRNFLIKCKSLFYFFSVVFFFPEIF